MPEYKDVLCILFTWSDIPYTTAFQYDIFSQPSIPSLVYIAATMISWDANPPSMAHWLCALRAPFQAAGSLRNMAG